MMGRNRNEGKKQLAREIHNPRFQLVHFENGTTKLSMYIATASYDKIVAGFEKRKFTVSKDGQS